MGTRPKSGSHAPSIDPRPVPQGPGFRGVSTMTQTAPTARTITDRQIELLLAEAEAHGDAGMARTCRRALARRGGRGECAAAIAARLAMLD